MNGINTSRLALVMVPQVLVACARMLLSSHGSIVWLYPPLTCCSVARRIQVGGSDDTALIIDGMTLALAIEHCTELFREVAT